MRRHKSPRFTRAPIPPAPAACPPRVPQPAQIRNAYRARYLAGVALEALEARRCDLGAAIAVTWPAEVVSKGAVDVPGAVRTVAQWKSAVDQVAAQREALETLLGIIADQIGRFKTVDPTGVISVLKEQISNLQTSQGQQEKEQSVRQAELRQLLEELNAIDPDQPRHAKESAKPGPRKA